LNNRSCLDRAVIVKIDCALCVHDLFLFKLKLRPTIIYWLSQVISKVREEEEFWLAGS
jgi:hypothetical protein